MKKSHPFRRVMLASAATVSGIVLLLTLKPSSDPGSAQAAGALPQQTSAAQAAQGGATAKDGTFTGDAVDTQYGPVQVRITVAGGKITKAEAVKAPSGGQSTTISDNAVPKLNAEAVAASTADIDAVSGATYTSAGYGKSLQSALDKASAGAGTGAPGGGGTAQAATVTGDAVDTQYGPVQVRITVAGGKITKAEAVKAPSGGQSTTISDNAVPKLNAAAVAAGNADIDAVSGASYTSAGYKESLQSALDKVPSGGSGAAASEAAGSEAAGSGAEAGGAAEGGAAEGSASGTGATANGGGTFTGRVVQTEYGPVQVRVTLTDGRITSASAIQAPKGGRSDQISADAIPKLNQAAITAGDGDVDAVSGASYTSAGYKESLQSALDQAGG